MIDPDLFKELSADPDIPESLLIELLALIDKSSHENVSDAELRRLYGDEFIDAYWDDEVFSPPVKKTPIDHKICPFLTTKQAAHYLGLSFRTLEKMRMSASGPSYRRHGRYIRYHIDDLDIWSKGRGGMSASSKSPR